MKKMMILSIPKLDIFEDFEDFEESGVECSISWRYLRVKHLRCRTLSSDSECSLFFN